jgi:cytoskeletal protein RodZ
LFGEQSLGLLRKSKEKKMGTRQTAPKKQKKQRTAKIKQWVVVAVILLIIASMILVEVSYIFM